MSRGDRVQISRQSQRAALTIENGEDRSDILYTRSVAIMGLIIPTIDVSVITFEIWDDALSWSPLYNADGTQVQIAATAGGVAISSDDLAPLSAYRYWRIATSVPQTAQRRFAVLVKA